jgi:gliding motility-associated-like protein
MIPLQMKNNWLFLILCVVCLLVAGRGAAQSCTPLYPHDTLVVGVAGSYMTLTASNTATMHTVGNTGESWFSAMPLTGGRIDLRIVETNDQLTARTGYILVGHGSCMDSIVLLQPGKNCEQGIDGTEGKLFFVAFSENIYQNNYSPPRTDLIMTAAQATSGTISNPRTGWSETFTVPANTVLTRNIALTHAYNSTGETVSNLGLQVTTERKISLYASNTESTSSDATNVLPVEALGDEYYTLSYNANVSTPEEFLIVASEDNTLITIVPTSQTGGTNGTSTGRPAGRPFNIRLQRGQTYLVKSRIAGSYDAVLGQYFYPSITGTYIKASRPVAVFSGHKRAKIGCAGNNSRDNLFQQLPPLRLWGTRYAVTPTGLVRDTYRVLAAYDQTVYTLNGVAQAPLDRGKFRDHTVAQGTYTFVEATHPISIGLFAESQDCSPATVSDPFLVLLNPIENEITDVTFAALSLSAITTQFTNIVVQQQAKAVTALVDATTGVPLTLSYIDIAGTNYAYARVPLQNNRSYRLHSDIGFTSYVYGFGNAESYAYSVGARFNHLTPPSVTADTSYCIGEEPKQPAAYDTTGTFLWYDADDAVLPLPGAPEVTTDTAAVYTYYVSRVEDCSESPRRAMTIRVYPPPVITFADTSVCAQADSLALALPAGGTFSGEGWRTERYFYPHLHGVGTFTVLYTYRDAHRCIDSASAVVVVKAPPAAPTITAAGSTTVCIGYSVTLTAVSGYSATSWQWFRNGAAVEDSVRQQFTATESGSYTVVVADAYGCVSDTSAAVEVKILPLPGSPVIVANQPLCAGDTLKVEGAVGENLTFLWYDNLGYFYGTAPELVVQNSGTYYAFIVNEAGCGMPTPYFEANVFPRPAVPVIVASGTTTICEGHSLTLTATGSYDALTTWQWFRNGAAVEDSVHQHFVATESGTYTVVAISDVGCMSDTSEAVEVTVVPLPGTPVIVANQPFCAGDTLRVEGVTAETPTYRWYYNEDGFATTAEVVVHFSGEYRVVVENEAGCGAPSPLLLLIVNPLPDTPTIVPSGAATFCAGQSVTLTATGSYDASTTWQWFRNGAAVADSVWQHFTATASGSYSVVAIGAAGCVSDTSAAVEVTVYPLPAAPVITAAGPLAFCAGDSVTLTATGSYGAMAWPWFRDGVPVGVSTGTYVVRASGTYTAVVVDEQYCTSAQPGNAVVVVVYPLPPAPQLNLTADTLLCSGDALALVATAPGAHHYQWYRNGAAVADSVNHHFTVTVSGSYSVVAISADGCPSPPSAALAVTVYSSPSVPPIDVSGATTFCAGGSVTLGSGINAQAFQWYRNGTEIPGASFYLFTATESGAYTLVVHGDNPYCSATSLPTEVTVYPLPATPVIAADGPLAFCAGDSVTLSGSGAANLTYRWYRNWVLEAGVSGSEYVARQSGTYTAVVEDEHHCMPVQAANLVEVVVYPPPPAPQLTASGPLWFCRGDAATLTASAPGAVDYLWSRNGTPLLDATGATYVATTAGSYTLVVRDANGCLSSSAINPMTIGVYELPANPLLEAVGATAFCQGGSAELWATAAGATSYAWFRNGAPWTTTVAATLTVDQGGTYTVVVSGAGSCAAPSPSNAIETRLLDTPAAPVLGGVPATAFCRGDAVTLAAFSADAESYVWYRNDRPITGATASTCTVTETGTYTAYALRGCVSATGTPPMLITVYEPPLVPVITAAGGPPFYIGMDYALQVQAPEAGVAYEWFYNQSYSGVVALRYLLLALSGQETGEYFVEAVSAQGCRQRSAPLQVEVELSPLFIPNIFTPNGDGINENFRIAGLENYVENELTVINKRGKLVFSTTNYQNEWYGENQPDDIYYYHLTLKDPSGTETRYKGYVNIKRR